MVDVIQIYFLHFRLQNFVSQIGIHLYLIPTLTDPIDEMRKKYGIESSGRKVQLLRSYKNGKISGFHSH